MIVSNEIIEMQVRPGLFHDKFMEYYNTLEDDEKVLFKKTLSPCLPYISTLEEVQDFLFWFNGSDPIYTVNKIRNNEYGYDLPKAMIWQAWREIHNKS